MVKKLLISLAPLLAIVAFVAMPTAAQAAKYNVSKSTTSRRNQAVPYHLVGQARADEQPRGHARGMRKRSHRLGLERRRRGP